MRRLVLLLCFVSGFSGLIYEVVWMRMLTFVFGVSAYATTTVLCAFMAGLALGSWAFCPAAERARPLRLYAWLEAGIAAYALALPSILRGLTSASIWVHGLSDGRALPVNLSRFLLAGVALLLPAALMGATVPVLGRYFVRTVGRAGGDSGLFYGVNTLGAVGGALTAGFVLLGRLGIRRTILCAVALNALVAAGAWAADLREIAARRTDTPRPPPSTAPTPLARLALVVFGVSGLVSLAWEVLWTRLLVFYLHNSVYAFSAMLIVFLLGLAAGSLATTLLADRVADAARALGVVQILIGVTSLLSIRVYMRLPDLAQSFSAHVPIHSFGAAAALMFFQSGLILLVPSILMGASFPLAARIVAAEPGRAARALGRLYAVNTCGTVLGAFLCGFALIPALGLGHTATVLVLISVLLGAGVLAMAPQTAKAGKATAVATAIAFVVLAPAVIPPDLFRDAFERRFARVLFYKDEASDTVTVAETLPGRLESRTIFYSDGRGTAGIFSAPENRVSGHLPMLLHRNPQDVLVICFGVGNSLAAVARHPAARIRCVELSPGVIETARFFSATNRDVLADPRVQLFIEDGRIHLLTARESYDVVTLEPPEMHTAGVVNLYTLEFYRLVRSRLKSEGVVCQWLNVRKMSEDDLRRLISAFRAVFPHTTLWQPPKCFGVLMLGSDGPLRVDLPDFLRRYADPRVFQDLDEVGLGEPLDFLSQFLMGEARTASYADGAPPVTDDRTWVDFAVPRSAAADYSVSGFFAGLRLDVRDHEGRLSSAQVGYEKIHRLSRERDDVTSILTGLESAGRPLEEIRSALDRHTAARRHACDPYGAGQGCP